MFYGSHHVCGTDRLSVISIPNNICTSIFGYLNVWWLSVTSKHYSKALVSSINVRWAPSSRVGPLPVVNGVDVMGTGWHPFTRADATVAENPPPSASPHPPPPSSELLRSLFCGEEVCGRPEEFQQGSVAPVGPTALRPTGRTECPGGGARLGLVGETAVTSTVSQEEEEMWVRLEELKGHRGLGAPRTGSS